MSMTMLQTHCNSSYCKRLCIILQFVLTYTKATLWRECIEAAGQCHGSSSSTSAILERRKDKARRAISTVSMLPTVAPTYKIHPLTLIAETCGPAKHTSQTQRWVGPLKAPVVPCSCIASVVVM
jgi:hypothetical protein